MSDSSVRLSMVGQDGSVWEVMDGSEGLTLGQGIKGVLFPKFEQKSADLLQGRRWLATRFKPAELSVTFQVGDLAGSQWPYLNRGTVRTGDEFIELDRRVRRALAPSGTVEFIADSTHGRRRIRYHVDSFDAKLDTMPDIRGYGEFDVEMISDSPFWTGDKIKSQSFVPDDTQVADYYGGSGPPFYLAASYQQVMDLLINTGDVECWPTWTLTGPMSAVVGIGDALIETQPIAAGESLRIVTSPWGRSVTIDGELAWDRLISRRFAPIPAKQKPGLMVATRDAGDGARITIEVQENYLGAW